MNFKEIKIYTKTENIDCISGQLALADILGYEIIDETEAADFLRKNVNNGTGYADYVEDFLLSPTTDKAIIKIYLEQSDTDKLEFINNIDQYLYGIEKIEIVEVNSDEWENKWREYYKPMEIGDDIVIVPVWEKYTGNHKKIFSIEPGHLFGTGLHQSTQACIEQIEKYAQDKHVLDLGCGTGILGIISLLCGAKHAVGVDIEATAQKIVTENAQLNGVEDRITIHVGNVLVDNILSEKLKSQKYELVTANIVADVIIAMLPFIKQVLLGKFIMAGIIDERENDVKKALTEHGFHIIETTYKESWVCIVAGFEVMS